MFELKRLSKRGIEAALEKAERYRLLQEPWEAESICRDILEVDPDNEPALIVLLLALTDQFRLKAGAECLAKARELLPRLPGEYERAYYSGVVCEREAKALLVRDHLGSGPVVYDWLRQAMEWYEKAEELRPPGNDSCLLRWNTCARIIMRHRSLRPERPDAPEMFLE
ncbi:MAG: hypothetical protein ACE5HP_02300 [Gemmatimonadota bacterium]